MNKMEYVHVLENGDISLTPKEFVNEMGPTGINISKVILPRIGYAIRWATDFLKGGEDLPAEYETNGTMYKVSRNSGNVFFHEYRNNNTNVVGFSAKEIPLVLTELKTVMGNA